MKNVKLFLKSWISNDAAIDGAIKKPWYAAIIIFFISIILSVIPTTVLELKKQGDKNFDNNTFLTQEAATWFSEQLQDSEFTEAMYVAKDGKVSRLYSHEFERIRENEQTGEKDFAFAYVTNEKTEDTIKLYNANNYSYFIFTNDTVYINIKNPNKRSESVIGLVCVNAYKKVKTNQIKETFVQKDTPTGTAQATWANWKVLIRKLYNQTRLKSAGIQLAIISAVNVGIALIMGFMVWVLTRGKSNVYRTFNPWDCFKISFWACMFPALLTVGFGFLIKSFAATLFPLLLGVRVMWLSMKSLRPDGSGYKLD